MTDASTIIDKLLIAAARLRPTLIGLVVTHRGRTLTVSPSCGQWEAVTECEPADCEPHDVVGFGETAEAALDACADEADLAEEDGEPCCELCGSASCPGAEGDPCEHEDADGEEDGE